MLKVNNLTVEFGKRTIFENVQFDVNAGELVCLLGANGAGKSTLLNTLCGDVKYKGQVSINGETLDTLDLKTLAKVRAVMPQKVILNFAFTCFEVVSMGRRVHRSILNEIDLDVIQTCMTLCGVWDFKDRRYPYLSGGEQQRVQLARVLAQIYIKEQQLNNTNYPPRLLLLDECTSSLDPKFQHEIYRILQSLKKQNIAILTIVHDINLASQYADRILLLSNGRLIEDACPHIAINSKRMLQTYDLHTKVIHHQSVSRPVVIALDQV
ncbi:MAG: heme ABC transporter ATP-binding protein [Saccharospirillaceae bacterium]|nr:heme ABC transporter ATP-binding protein [Pseudomonadales bacterium]NRB80266.1 heme ABC transporter ATP-binding protein [Saccharospirillaceae bacterium]